MTKRRRAPAQAYTRSGFLLSLRAGSPAEAGWPISAWAAVCGVVASGGFGWEGADWLRFVLLILLVDLAWGSLWNAVQRPDWQVALKQWRSWEVPKKKGKGRIKLREPRRKRLLTWLGQVIGWWREVLWPENGADIATAIAALLASAALSVQLGVGPVLASLAALAVLQMALLGRKGGIAGGAAWPIVPSTVLSLLGAEVVFVAVLPWVAGQLAYGRLTTVSLAMAATFAIAYRAAPQESAGGRLIGIGAQLMAAIILLVLRRPAGAGCLALFLAPQIALLPWLRLDHPVHWYVRHTRPWLAAAMFVAAASL
jgi:hypothetical protein